MITLTRRQARRLRAVFRRRALGIAHRGPIPPLVVHADPDAGLRVRFHHAPLAVERLLPGTARPAEAIALPLDALAECEGRDDTPVVLEAADPVTTVVRWDDRGIPRTRTYPIARPADLPAFPELPTRFAACPGTLREALAEAAATAGDDSSRYALGCLQLTGGHAGQVVATDGHQLLIRGGLDLPWDGAVLVRRSALFANRELACDRAIEVGRTDSHVVLRIGPWTLWLTIQADARFPRVADALPAEAAVTTRLSLDPDDARFLADALDRLPGGDGFNAPVTLDLNGAIAVRARGADTERPTELVLARSRYAGEPVRVQTNRVYLARALGLGFAAIGLCGPEQPLVCRDGARHFGWQPLSAGSALGPGADTVRIESTTSPVGPTAGRVHRLDHDPIHETRTPMKENDHRNGHDAARSGPAADESSRPPGLVALIQEAEALHAALGDARTRTARLIAALRRHRKRSRLMESTLSALKQLKLAEVTE